MRLIALVTVAGCLVCARLDAQPASQPVKPQPVASPATPAAPAPAKPDAPAPPKPAPPAPPAAAPGPGAPAPPASGTPAEGNAPAAEAPPAEVYTYRADGRRDPFLSIFGSGPAATASTRRGEGAAGLAVGEISVRGVMQSRGSLVAMVMGPDNKTYIVHQGDKFLDGTIKTITPQGLVVVQEVNDPLSLVKQREVRKLLRSLEDAKE
jgi:Tfp pilus assembly protein PilP